MKKILIINGEPFQDRTATGITLKNIFNIIPKTDLRFIHISKLYPDLEYLDNVFSYYKDTVESKTSKSIPLESKARRVTQNRIIEFAKKELRNWDDLRKARFSTKIKQYIIESEAQIIYSCLGSLKVISLVLQAQKILNCKVVPHFMDDWKSVIFSDKRFIFHKLRLKNQLYILFKNVVNGLAISESMTLQYKKEFKIPFFFVMNSIPDEQIKELILNDKHTTKKFLYTGGLHLNRWKSLLMLCEAFHVIGQEHRLSIDIYCPENDKDIFENYFFKFNFIAFRGHVPSVKINEILSEADVLIHCESFDNYTRKYTKLSISTKIPLYLKEGKIILAFGPEEIESINYIKRNDAGVAISVEEPNLLIKTLLKEVFVNNNISRIRMNALTLFKLNHSYSSIKKKLELAFN